MTSQRDPAGEVVLDVPASSANLGPGFDSIGLALGIYDRVTARVEGRGLSISVAGTGAGDVPLDEGHLVWQSMVRMWERLAVAPPLGLRLECDNTIPHSRGLGSSAAAIVAGVAAAACLSGLSLHDRDDLRLVNDVAATLEGHPDNSSASVYGGLTVSWWESGAEQWRTTRAKLHESVRATVFVPDARLATHEARAALPATVSLRDAAANSGRAALLLLALANEPELLLPATRDWLHQEARRTAYPASMRLVDRLRAAGHAAVISGAGPSVLVLGTGPIDLEPGEQWRRLDPEIPSTGVRGLSHARS